MHSRTYIPTRLKAIRCLTLIALAVGIVIRALYLDADPQYYDWIGYLPDEGRWVHQARNFFLFHTIDRDDLYDLHLLLAPIFQLVNYFVYQLFGFSGQSSRIFTAICGIALLLLFWQRLRNIVTPMALLAGITILAVQVDFVVLSRLAVPEMAIIFFQALVYFALVSREPSRRRMVMLGALMLVAVGMKGTVVLSLGIFSLMLLFLPLASGESVAGSRRWENLVWFFGGFAAPILLAGAVWVACCAPMSLLALGELPGSHHLTRLIGFLRFSDAYHILSFPFKDALAPALNFLALGLWLSWLGWIAADREEIDTLSRRFLVTSTIWIVAYLALMLALAYFPQRYMVHIVLPMSINITVGISLLQKVGIDKALAALQRKDTVQLLRLAVFVLPTAVFLAPLLASALALAGIDPNPLRTQLACVALAVAVTTCIARQITGREQALNFLIVFPLMQASFWAVLTAAVENATLWPTVGGEFSRSLYLGSVAVASLATMAMTFTGRGAVAGVARLVAIYALGYLTASIIRLAPAYLDPHYTIRDISIDLGELYVGAAPIATRGAEGLFNDNSLRYRRFYRDSWRSNPPEIVVISNAVSAGEIELLRERYHLIKTYVPYVSPDYHNAHPELPFPEIKIYKKNP